MIKTGQVKKEFLKDPLTTLKILEVIQFYSKLIDELKLSNESEALKLIDGLKNNVENIRKVYNIYSGNIFSEIMSNNISVDDLKTYKMFSTTLENLFKDLLK